MMTRARLIVLVLLHSAMEHVGGRTKDAWRHLYPRSWRRRRRSLEGNVLMTPRDASAGPGKTPVRGPRAGGRGGIGYAREAHLFRRPRNEPRTRV